MLKIFNIPEPIWGQHLLKIMNDFIHKHYILQKMTPFAADIFVFTYPVYLVILYLYGIYKKDVNYKYCALYIFLSGASSIALNLFIQLFVDKQRPEQIFLSKDNLIFEHVPDSPFPSDHAALSSAIAMATLLWGIKTKNKVLINLSYMFFLFSIIMGVARIAAGVHWPTDIIVGIMIGMIVAWIIIQDKVLSKIQKYIFDPIINIEKKLFNYLFEIKQ